MVPPVTNPIDARLRAPLAAAGAVVAGTALVAVVDPAVPGRYPLCPFLTLTGCACPLCGGLRAVHALTRLDLPTALAHNVLVPPLTVVAVAWWCYWLARTARGLTVDTRFTRWVYRGVLTLGISFWVARNLPGWEALLPD